jgi:hypothetical protein
MCACVRAWCSDGKIRSRPSRRRRCVVCVCAWMRTAKWSAPNRITKRNKRHGQRQTTEVVSKDRAKLLRKRCSCFCVRWQRRFRPWSSHRGPCTKRSSAAGRTAPACAPAMHGRAQEHAGGAGRRKSERRKLPTNVCRFFPHKQSVSSPRALPARAYSFAIDSIHQHAQVHTQREKEKSPQQIGTWLRLTVSNESSR